MKYPYAHNLIHALLNLKHALSQEGNLEFVRDVGDGSALEFARSVDSQVSAIKQSMTDEAHN